MLYIMVDFLNINMNYLGKKMYEKYTIGTSIYLSWNKIEEIIN